MSTTQAIIFDLDGVLIDSEQAWNQARRQFTIESGGRWRDEATRNMMGMSSVEWSAYMHDELKIPLEAVEINERVVEQMEALYRRQLPLIPGAIEAVKRMSARWPLGLASSANRELINLFLELTGLGEEFQVSMSSEQVERGKPSPDVYLTVADLMGVDPARCVAVEDSANGIRSGRAAGMKVVAIPNSHIPPEPEALALADLVIESLADLTPETITQKF